MFGYIGEIMIVAFDFAPRGWVSCNGQILPVNQNQPLYSLIGNKYGGDGRTSFALPDMRGRTPVGYGWLGDDFTDVADKIGTERVTITLKQLYAESRKAQAGEHTPKTEKNILVTTAGPEEQVAIMQPYIVANYIIALTGIFPSRK